MKKILTILLTCCLVFALTPTKQTNASSNIISGKPTITVNSTIIAFAGIDWTVIGYNGAGINTNKNDNKVTLLCKGDWTNNYGGSYFRKGSETEFENSTPYTYLFNFSVEMVEYYANNPSTMKNWSNPNEYAGSSIQQKLESIADNYSTKEQSLIVKRNVSNGIRGQAINDQRLWLLSESEYKSLPNTVSIYRNSYWLRSGDSSVGNAAIQIFVSYPILNSNISLIQNSSLVRPATTLNLSSVLFTSSASSSGKSAASVGENLQKATATSGTIKFTMKHTSQTLNVNSITSESSNGKLYFSYSNATTGTNQYVSCVLTDANGNVVYYGKLANSSTLSSGSGSIPLSGVSDGTYTLKIFSEEANGDLYTDFCSEPVTMTLTVGSGKAIVSNFSGNIHTHNWATVYSHNATAHWRECTSANCPISDNSQKDGYATHSYDQSIVSDTYKKNEADCETSLTYYKSCICSVFVSGDYAATFTVGDPLGHNWASVYSYDGDYHWYECLNENCPIAYKELNNGYAEHLYDQKVISEEYEEFDANCLSAATYFYSCICGAIGGDTFIFGDPLGHNWSEEWTIGSTHHWHECLNDNCPTYLDSEKDGYQLHEYDQNVIDESYLKTEADCEKASVYYKSCKCGDCGTEEFTVGSPLGHSFSSQWTITDTHHYHKCLNINCPITLESENDCYGEHKYDQCVIDEKYLKTAAECESEAVYYKSCICGKFISGEDSATFTTETLGHKYSDEYLYNENGHWHVCTREGCNKVSEIVGHNEKDDGNCLSEFVCECGYTIREAQNEHEWSKWQADGFKKHTRYCQYEGICEQKEVQDCVDENKDDLCDICSQSMIKKLPATGDESIYWFATFAVSGALMIYLYQKKKYLMK